MEPEGFCSQGLDTIPFMDPDKSSLQTTSHGIFIMNFNIFLPYTPRSSKQCSSFRLSQQASYGSVVCPTRSTCTQPPIHFDFFIINMFAKEWKSWSFFLRSFLQLIVTASALLPIHFCQHLVLERLQCVFLSQCDISSITSTQTRVIIFWAF